MSDRSAEPSPIRIFFSYSHKDERFRKKLETALASLQRQGLVATWHDRKLIAGTEWDREIKAELNQADLILLLVSPDFIASDYCYEIEVKWALERHEAKDAYVVPIVLRPCLWQGGNMPFSKLATLPQDGIPATDGRWKNQDEAFLNVANDIARLVREEIPKRQAQKKVEQEALIQQVREHCRQKILDQHSRMRLLSGEEIGVDQLYVDVWVLNRSPRTFQVSPDKLLETFDLRHDRLGLGDRIKRNPGFEVANNNPKLVILGKPGSGKTTLLKHLVVDWYKGLFQSDLITVLIELRQIHAVCNSFF